MSKQLTVKKLIERLNNVKDKSLPVRIATPFDNDELIDVNLWLYDELYEHSTGMSGYEIEGELEINTKT